MSALYYSPLSTPPELGQCEPCDSDALLCSLCCLLCSSRFTSLRCVTSSRQLSGVADSFLVRQTTSEAFVSAFLPLGVMSDTATVARPADSPSAITDAANCNTVSDTHSATAPASPTSAASTSTTTPSTPATPSSSSAARLVSTSSSASTPASQPSPTNPLALPSSSSTTSCSPTSAARRICLLRLASDLKSLENDPPEGIDASPLDSSNLLLWRGCLFGPPDSEWEGAVLPLQLSFPPDYPQKPPVVRFTCKLYHPNVFSDGKLCLDIVQDKWSPVYTVGTILTSIQSLLTDPNTSSPANPEASKTYSNDRKEYRKQVRQCVARISGM